MKKITLLILAALIMSSCCGAYYYKDIPTQTTGIDFSTGRWLLGNVEVDGNFKVELTQMIYKDFSIHLNDRLRNSLEERFLIAQNVPLNPSKSTISDLRKGTNCDYYINVKCASQRNHSDKDLIDSWYYMEDKTFGVVQLEVYDLNSGQIVYSQRVRGSYSEDTNMSMNGQKKLVVGCYQRIMKDINEKS